jgi:hypothetical protein
MDEQNRFFDRLSAEYDVFIDYLRGRSADEIINASYRKVCYDEFVAAFEGADYNECDFAAFNKQDELLDSLYSAWLDADTADFEQLPNLIERFAEREMGYTLELREEYEDTERGDSEKSAADIPAKIADEANLEAALIARVERNYADYRNSLSGFGAGELIEMAAAIHAHSDAWSYMTEYHAYSDEELQFYMQFENPLEIVADKWQERNIDVGDVSFTMDFLMEPERQKDTLEAYPRIAAENPAAEPVAEPAVEPVEQEDPPKSAPKRAIPPVKPEPPKKQSINSQLDGAIEEAQERNAARTPQTQQKSKNKEID